MNAERQLKRPTTSNSGRESIAVVPAQAGITLAVACIPTLDSGVRRNDRFGLHYRSPLIATLITAALGACAGVPKSDPAFAPIPASAYPRPVDASAGAIYRDGSGGLSLFADKRAHYAGDLITINLVESTQATTTKSTTTEKKTGVSMAGPSVFGGPVTLDGRDVLDTSITTDNSFEGKGDSSQSNRLTGAVTVTVINRLPNGNLLVRGEKLLRLNQSDEVIQVQGIVRPADIGTDNAVLSSRVADARIVYTGRGALAQANVQGWLSRFFNSPVMP